MDWKTRVTRKLEEILKKATKMDAPATPPAPMQGPVLYYTPQVIEHFSSPRNVGEMNPEEADGYALIGDPSCGDQMKLWIKVENERIVDIRFRSFGCPGAIATSSMATELARGRTLQEAIDLTDDEVIAALGGIPENKRHCSLLGINALHAAVADFLQRASVDAQPQPVAAS